MGKPERRLNKQERKQKIKNLVDEMCSELENTIEDSDRLLYSVSQEGR